MTDKEKIRTEIEKVKVIIQSNRAQGAFAESYLIGQESVLEHFENYVNSMQEEPTIPDIVDEHFDEMLDEEPVSDDLIQASEEYVSPWQVYAEDTDGELLLTSEPCERAFVSGAQWQKKHFEENRLKHCDSITNEQAELEQGFIDQHLDKYNRMPTFLDAIEYGMKLKEKIMKEAPEAVFGYGNFALPEDIKKQLKYGDKVKVIIIKETK